MDPRSRRVVSNGKYVRLTNQEFVLLNRLVRNAGSVVTRTELLQDLPNSPRALEVHISSLRKKLGAGPDIIRSVRGSGYLFTGETTI